MWLWGYSLIPQFLIRFPYPKGRIVSTLDSLSNKLGEICFSMSHTDGMEILFILGLWAASLDSCSAVIKSIVLVWILLKSEPEFKIQFIQQVTLRSKKEEVVWAKGIMRPENDSKSTEAALVMGT